MGWDDGQDQQRNVRTVPWTVHMMRKDGPQKERKKGKVTEWDGTMDKTSRGM